MKNVLAIIVYMCYNCKDENKYDLIKSGGGTSPVKPRQPALCKVLILGDEKNEISDCVGDFLMKGNLKNEKNAFYI